MSIKIYIGKQDSEKIKCIPAKLIDAGATDFNIDEQITALESEVFNDLAAKGDSVIGKIEVSGAIPIELTEKVLEELLPGISYKKFQNDYKMDKEKPAFYTIVLVDSENDEKWEYVDCVINDIAINVVVGGYVKGNINIIGKTYEIGNGNIIGAKSRGESLRCLYANINLDGIDISSDVEGVDIEISNGIEAKGSLNSLYNSKIRRNKQIETKISIQKNEYDGVSFKKLKEKMINGTSVECTIKLGNSNHSDIIIIKAPKLYINSNKRGDYKGVGTHNIDLQASVNNLENSHLKISFKSEED